MLIIGSYHKTGTKIWRNIWKDYFKENNNLFKFYHHFNRIVNNLKEEKCLVLIRNPYEIIMSGMRYHQITNEEWCIKKFGNHSYKSYIKSLPIDKKIIFEMNNCAKDTILDIYNDIKFHNKNNNILFLKLEDITDNRKLGEICYKICKFTNNKISFKRLYSIILSKIKIKYNKTTNHKGYTYQKYFKREHFDLFNKLFPDDLLEIMGY